ncbi:MAG: hypothetical protein QG622_1141 [Actinomycetota bacterium]|nr:hypothetical protein [Actinomycetota bacterium]
MSSLLDRTVGLSRPVPLAAPPSSPLVVACLAASRAVVTGVVPVVVPVAIAWILGAGGQTTWSQTLRFSASLWLLAHHVGLAVSGGHVGLTPMGLFAVPLAACWFAGRRLARQLDPCAERIDAGATRISPRAPKRWVLLAFALAYSAMVTVIALIAAMPGLSPVAWQAVPGGLAIGMTGGVLGAAAWRYSTAPRKGWTLARLLPMAVRPWLRPALGAVTTWLAVGLVTVTALVVLHGDRVMDVQRVLDAGLVGGVVLTLGELLLLPNLAVWAAAASSGPGFALGAGTAVTVTSSSLGPVPTIPVLAALPANGPLPTIGLMLLAVPLLAGVVAGALILQRPPETFATRLRHVAGTSLLATGAAGLLAWLSGGPAGPGRLAQVGPDLLNTGAAFGAEVALGAVLVVLAAAAVPDLAVRQRSRRHANS